MKTLHTVLTLFFLSPAARADEIGSISWPISSPFAAREATVRAVSSASLAGSARFSAPVAMGFLAPPLAFFLRKEGEGFDVFLARATRGPLLRRVDSAKVSLCDEFHNVVWTFGFRVSGDAAADLDSGMHASVRRPESACFVPLDVPPGYVVSLALIRVPSANVPRILLDGNVISVPGAPAVHRLDARKGRLYFPWPLVGDDVTELAVAAVDDSERGAARVFLCASTLGSRRGRVSVLRSPPGWWPAEEVPAPILTVGK